jgi:hypothetical protein
MTTPSDAILEVETRRYFHSSLTIPQPLRLTKNPLFGRYFFILVLISRTFTATIPPRRNPASFQRPQYALIIRPHEIDHAVPWPQSLLAWRRHDTMSPRPQDAVGEFARCIAEVDDCTVGLWSNP